jgi:probable rRNA maturation factor
MASINFFYQEIDFKVPFPRKTSQWIKEAIRKEKQSLNQLNYIFCDDNFLQQINEQYLNHKSLTDIITFDNRENQKEIEGDIYISVIRVRENARKFKVSFEEELRRVIIHGALHLLGYKDKTERSKKQMRKKEDAYLSLFR